MFLRHVSRFTSVSLLLCGLLTAPANLLAADSIGEATLAVQAEAVPRKELQAGDPVFVGNEFVVGAEGTLSILFIDESLLTLLPGSRAIIEEYSIGDKGQKGKCVIKVLAGQYRWVPGKILADGGLQYIADSSTGKTDHVVNVGQPPGAFGSGQGRLGKGAEAPDIAASTDGAAPSGGTTAGTLYDTEYHGPKPGPAPMPTFPVSEMPERETAETEGFSAGIPIINTGSSAGDNPPKTYIPPDLSGIGAGTNFIPTDDMRTQQNGMLQQLDPAATAAADIAGMMNPAAPAVHGGPVVGIVEPGMSGGLGASPNRETGQVAYPVPASGSTLGALTGRAATIGPVAAPSSPVNGPDVSKIVVVTTAPAMETGGAAPKIVTGTVVPKIDIASGSAPRVEMTEMQSPAVGLETTVAPRLEIGTTTVPTATIDIRTKSAPLMK